MLKLATILVFLLAPQAGGAEPSGEHLIYTVGCVNCHHQTPKAIINAPPLSIVASYSLPEFRVLMKTGVTRSGRDMLAQSSVMGIVAVEQFAHFTDEEIQAIYTYLTTQWTPAMAAKEEAKIPVLYKAAIEKGELKP